MDAKPIHFHFGLMVGNFSEGVRLWMRVPTDFNAKRMHLSEDFQTNHRTRVESFFAS